MKMILILIKDNLKLFIAKKILDLITKIELLKRIMDMKIYLNLNQKLKNMHI